MARGGKRSGAGRKVGALTKRTRAVAEQAAAEGKTPLEILLDNMRHFQQVAIDAEIAIQAMTADELANEAGDPEQQFKLLLAKVKQAAGFRVMAVECARDAAPYIHPKLSAVAHTGADGGPVIFKTIYEQQPG